MYAATILLVAFMSYIATNILFIYFKNRKAHQFFKLKSPKLPVVPPHNVFFGSMMAICLHNKNWLLNIELHRKLGKSFGFYVSDQPWVSTQDLDLLKLVEIDEAHKHINRVKLLLPFYEFDHSIFQADGDDWRRIRRSIAPALTNHKVHSSEVSADIEHIISQLSAGIEVRMTRQAGPKKGNTQRSMLFNVGDTCHRYAMAVVFLLTYKRDNVINFDKDHDNWVNAVDRNSRQLVNPFILASMAFPFLRPILTHLVRLHSVGRMHLQIIKYIGDATDINRVARKRHEKMQRNLGQKQEGFSSLTSQGKFKRRLVDNLIDAFIEKKITYDGFMGTALFLLLAGFETTADTISFLVWTLSQKPDIQEKLRAALIEEGIDSEYLNWCVMETVRYHPAVPLGTGRILTEDVTVNGIRYPRGAYIMPSTYGIHHDPNIWPDADEFKPERWKDTSGLHPAAFMGFGLGPRNCVGGKLAIHEVKLVLQMLLSKYRIEKCAETVDEYEFSSPGTLYTFPDKTIYVRLVELERPKLI